jgi:hypothetical protein
MIAREIKAGSFGCHRKLKAALISVITSPLFIPRGALPLALALAAPSTSPSRSPVAPVVAPAPRTPSSRRGQKLHRRGRRGLFIRLQHAIEQRLRGVAA